MKLDAWLRQDHSLVDRLLVVERLAQALNELHDRGEPLAALEPDRIEIGGDGRCDISAARRGSPSTAYGAPERAEGGPPSPEADIYSAGVIAWEILAGRRCGSSPQHLSEARPDLPRELADAVMACLEKSSQWRPRDLTYLAQLAQHAQGSRRKTETTSTPARGTTTPRRSTGRTAAVRVPPPASGSSSNTMRLVLGAVFLLAAAGGGYYWFNRGSAVTGPPAAGARPPAVAPTTPVPAAAANAIPPSAPPVSTPAPAATAVAAVVPTAAPRPTPSPVAPPIGTTVGSQPGTQRTASVDTQTRPAVPVTPTPLPFPRTATVVAPPTTTLPPRPSLPPTAAPVTTTTTTAPAPAAPVVAREPATLTAVSPLSVRRPGKVLVDLRGTGLHDGLRPRILQLRETPRGIVVVRHKCVSDTLVNVLLDLDATVTPAAYAIVLEDAAGRTTKPLTFTVDR